MLDRLAAKFGTDKLKHGYIPVYDRLFSKIRTHDICILEIGFGHGASIRMWHEYFPTASIYCFDRDRHDFVLDRCHMIQGDQSSRADIESLAERQYNIIIDDGSHTPEHQQMTLEILLPKVALGGTFIIEDLHTNRSTNIEKTLPVLLRYIHTGKLTSQMFAGDLGPLLHSCKLELKGKLAVMKRACQ